MSIPEKFVPNQRLDGFPGGTMNWATDNIERLLAAGMPPAEAVARLSGAPLALSVLVKNETSGHVPPGGVLTSGGPVANAAQEPSQRLRPKLKGLAPAADKLVLISQSGIAPGGAGPCNYQGLCTAWVDVSDVDHTFAKITAGESLQLESTADSTNLKMEWFEHQGEAPPGGGGEDPRLGRQLALLNIGGGVGGGIQRGISAGEGSGPTKWDNTEDAYTGNCIEVYLLTTPPLWEQFTDYTAGDRVVVPVDEWAPSTTYSTGDVVRHEGQLYKADSGFTSGPTFNASNWTQQGCHAQGAIYSAVSNHTSGETFSDANWTLLDGYESIDRSSTVTWRNDIQGSVEAGHLVKAVDGDLVFYDCDQLTGWA